MMHETLRIYLRRPLIVICLAVGIAGLAWSSVATESAQTSGAPAPKLVVLIVVDQMRADYIDRFNAEWTSGLKRLVRDGAWFRRAAYPYLATVTCAGHATVATGAFPHTHGIIQNGWWDRTLRKAVTCTEDPTARDIGYGVPAQGGDSAFRLQIPSLADRLRSDKAGHIVSLSLKSRSAIMLAGHGGDAVAWLADAPDGWVTSSVFTAAPVPAVRSFTQANAMTADYGRIWTRLLPPSRYHGPDDGLAEAPPNGWTTIFPHALSGTGGKPNGDFLAQWETSPFADAYLGRFAGAVLESTGLGKHAGIDLLAVSFSSPDLVGHAFGPQSQETEDMYAHLDRTIGALLARLDTLVGRDEYVVALTADHGVTDIPEQLVALGKDAGRIDLGGIGQAMEDRMRPTLGPGAHIAQVSGNDVYFEPGVYQALEASPSTLDAVVSAVAGSPGIERVFRAEQLVGASTSADPLVRAAALSYFPERSGDLILVPKAGWMFASSGTTHGTASADDQRVPIILFGHGIKPGHYSKPITPADIAPTLAVLCDVTLPAAEGHALRSALATPHRRGSP